jgi:hypothetical protein
MKKIFFDEHEFPVPGDMTLDEAQEWAADAVPAIADAEGRINDDGDFVFTKKAGTKGL